MIMEQIANTDNGSTEREKAGSDMTSVQEGVGALNPSLSARVEFAIEQQPEFGVLRAKLLEHGGAEVVPPCGWNDDLRQLVIVPDPDLPALLDHGYLMTGPVVCRSRGMERVTATKTLLGCGFKREQGTHSSELQLDIAWIMICGFSVRGVCVRILCWRPSASVTVTLGFGWKASMLTYLRLTFWQETRQPGRCSILSWY
jgi:hypothetical protein